MLGQHNPRYLSGPRRPVWHGTATVSPAATEPANARGCQTVTSNPPTTGLFQPRVRERLWLAPGYGQMLARAGLVDVRSVMDSTHGQRMRSVECRENWILELHGPDGRPVVAFLKKHRTSRRRFWWRAFVPQEVSPGWGEAENLRRLEAAGVPTMTLLACGERTPIGGQVESFVLTEGLQGYEPLDDFLARRQASATLQWRRRLVLAVAHVARRFHTAGFNHRDFYACHFFVREEPSGEFDIRLIDLQRVQMRRFRHRWLIKDLAQLDFSLADRLVNCTERVAFMRTYLDVRGLRPVDKRLIRRARAKARRIARREETRG